MMTYASFIPFHDDPDRFHHTRSCCEAISRSWIFISIIGRHADYAWAWNQVGLFFSLFDDIY